MYIASPTQSTTSGRAAAHTLPSGLPSLCGRSALVPGPTHMSPAMTQRVRVWGLRPHNTPRQLQHSPFSLLPCSNSLRRRFRLPNTARWPSVRGHGRHKQRYPYLPNTNNTARPTPSPSDAIRLDLLSSCICAPSTPNHDLSVPCLSFHPPPRHADTATASRNTHTMFCIR